MTRGLGGHSPANVSHDLRGIGFPARKQDALRKAQENAADQDVVEVIEAMPDEDKAWQT